MKIPKQESKIFVIFILVGSFLLLTADVVLAGSASLGWNANSESDVEGYKIYYDTSSHAGTCPAGYANSLDVGKVTSHWFDNLTPGRTYYFQLTAHDTSGNESACSTSSGEVSKLITYRGDINSSPDHAVNLSDLSILATDYGKTSWCGPTHKADINRDCTVNLSDLSIMAGEYNQSF